MSGGLEGLRLEGWALSSLGWMWGSLLLGRLMGVYK